MQLDGTIEMPDGRRLPVLVEVDPRHLEPQSGTEDLAWLTARATEALGDRSRALAWLHTPLPSLDGRTPLRAMDSPEGRMEVADILGRVESGVFG